MVHFSPAFYRRQGRSDLQPGPPYNCRRPASDKTLRFIDSPFLGGRGAFLGQNRWSDLDLSKLFEPGCRFDIGETGFTDGVRDLYMQTYSVARDWWAAAGSGWLPGEVGGVTVFAIHFADGCCYFGYTGSRVFDRVCALAMRWGAYKTNASVSAHAVRCPMW